MLFSCCENTIGAETFISTVINIERLKMIRIFTGMFLLFIPLTVFAQPEATLINSVSLIEKSTQLHPPYYDIARLENFINSVATHPLVEKKILGQSVLGRNVIMVTITDNSIPDSCKKSVWLQCRVHGYEDEQSYIFEGLVNYLISDDSTSIVPEILKRIIFKIIPAINPDGIALWSRMNANGIDLNSIWVDSTDHSTEEPEVRWVHDALDDWVITQGNKIYLALDMHCWDGGHDGGYQIVANIAGDDLYAEQTTFLTYLIEYCPWQRWEDWSSGTGSSGSALFALFRQHGLNILKSETTGGDRYDGSVTTIANLQEQGVSFVNAIYRYLYHIYFVDGNNNEVDTYSTSDSIYIKLEDFDANDNPGIFEEYQVLLVSSSLDTEHVFIKERFSNGGIFYNETGVGLAENIPVPNDGVLQVKHDDIISVYYEDINFPDDFCSSQALIVPISNVSPVTATSSITDYKLYPNYPNPFNTGTIISFSIPSRGSRQQLVSVKIYNLLGEEIITLVDGQLSPGQYSLSWNGKDRYGNSLGSGIYLCHLFTEKIQLVRKLLLVQ